MNERFCDCSSLSPSRLSLSGFPWSPPLLESSISSSSPPPPLSSLSSLPHHHLNRHHNHQPSWPLSPSMSKSSVDWLIDSFCLPPPCVYVCVYWSIYINLSLSIYFLWVLKAEHSIISINIFFQEYMLGTPITKRIKFQLQWWFCAIQEKK